MPSPLRRDGGIAYTRWEPVDSNDDDTESLQLPFHHFEEESPRLASQALNSSGPHDPHSHGPSILSPFHLRSPRDHHHQQQQQRQRRPSSSLSASPRVSRVVPGGPFDERCSNACLNAGLKVLAGTTVLVVGILIGFLVNRGIHEYYIDPLGHCVAPAPYSYNSATASLAMESVNFTHIRQHFLDFTEFEHEVGSEMSRQFAANVTRLWKSYGLDKVEVEQVMVKVPVRAAMPSQLVVKEESGERAGEASVRWTLKLEDAAKVAFSAQAIGSGHLAYGHFGRFEDFTRLGRTVRFEKSVVVLRINPLYHTGSVVRNAQHFGAKAVILFPDPIGFKMVDREEQDTLPHNVTLSQIVKFFPGDPNSPYLPGRRRESLPQIPVASVSFENARELLANYTDMTGVPEKFLAGMGFAGNSTGNSLGLAGNPGKFTVQVEVNTEFEEKELHNVIGTIPGRYEPTRYLLVAGHHDTWRKGSSKPAAGHSVLMELTRVLGELHKHGWKPARSILLASWDGEELGQLGSTAWMLRHSKELVSRAVAYVDLDYALQLHGGAAGGPGAAGGQVAASPLFRDLIELAAKSVPCEPHTYHEDHSESEHQCNLHHTWTVDQVHPGGQPKPHLSIPPAFSMFQNVLGVSTIQVALKEPASSASRNSFVPPSNVSSLSQLTLVGDIGSHIMNQLNRMLDPKLRYYQLVTKFLVVLVLKLVMVPQLPGQTGDYSSKVSADSDKFLTEHATQLGAVNVQELETALANFGKAAERFHSTYDSTGPLALLGHHEYSDQLLELERSFLLPASQAGHSRVANALLKNPFKHVIYGPDPLNLARMVLFPQLTASLQVAKAMGDNEKAMDGKANKIDLENDIAAEVFFVVDALDSAACVLDNHLVYTYPEDVKEVKGKEGHDQNGIS